MNSSKFQTPSFREISDPKTSTRVLLRRSRNRKFGTLLLWGCWCHALLFCLNARAQYSIDWSTIDGGGGTGTGGVYTVTSTIGQADAGGPMTGGQYSLSGGFWALYAVQTPGAPFLSIARTATNAITVTWPSASTGWLLQQNTNSISSVNWSSVTATIQDDGTTKTLLVSPPIGNRFYRLFKP